MLPKMVYRKPQGLKDNKIALEDADSRSSVTMFHLVVVSSTNS